MGAGIMFNSRSAPQSPVLGPLPPSPVVDRSRFDAELFPMEVCPVFFIRCNSIFMFVHDVIVLVYFVAGLR